MVNLKILANALHQMKIDKLHIFSIHKHEKSDDERVERIKIEEPMIINYVDISYNKFIEFINQPDIDFLNFNKNTLYILRDGDFLDVKNLFTKINNCDVNVGRGGSQKSHIISPLELRMLTYLLVMYNFDYKYISYINTFNDLNKSRYLPYIDNSIKYQTFIKNKTLSSKPILNSNIKTNKPSNSREYHTSISKTDNNENTFPLASSMEENTDVNQVSVFSYLDQIEEIINTTETLRDAQEAIETNWISLMKTKLEDPSVSSWRMLPKLIRKSVNTLEKHSQKGILKRRFKTLSNQLSGNKSEVVLLTISILVSNYTKSSATNIAIQIGSNIAFLLYKKDIYKDINPQNFKNKFNNWKKFNELDSNVKLLKLGDYFINLFTNEPTQIFEFGLDEEDLIDTNSERIMKIAPEYINMIKETLIVHPTSLPMISEPNEWSDTSYGGFFENKYAQEPINTGSSYQGHRIDNKKSLYDSVNLLNKIKFNVNKELLNYILNEGSYLLECDKDDNDKRNLQNSITIKVAKIYSKYNFYLNVNSDWRGRLYTNSFFLSYQGNDLSRSLIEFADGEKLSKEGLKYLYIFGANCYSDALGKKSINKRIAWIKDNMSKIVNLDKDFINNANKKIQFASFCIAIKNYELDNNFEIKLPIFLDATCSGIQHLSAMLQDINLGAHVNLLSKTEEEDVCDLYQTFVDPINKSINKFGRENYTHSLLKNVKLDRKIIKTPIMTGVYSVTVDGIYRQLIKKFKKTRVAHTTEKTKDGNTKYNTYYFVPNNQGGFEKLFYADVYKIAEIIKNASFNAYPSLKEIYSFFIDSAKLMVELKIPIVWFTPAGLEISQFYYTSIKEKVKLSYFGKTKTSVIRRWEEIVDKNKQNNSIVPNIIHSLDASHLINVINNGNSKGITPIISIHDCFGTHPNKMENLSKLVRSEFVLLYTQHNFLERYYENVINSIKDNNYKIIEKDSKKYVSYYPLKIRKKDKSVYVSKKEKLSLIPSTPNLGNLDLKNIINAIYLIN